MIDGDCEECMKEKYDEQWDVIDVGARIFFSCCAPSLIKHIAGMSLHGERTKKIDKSNKTGECPVCGEKEDWEHVLLCEKNENERDKWMKDLEVKMKKIE